MRRRGGFVVAAGAVGFALPLWGCNQVLGIHATVAEDWDGSVVARSPGSGETSPGGGESMNAGSGSDSSVPPPADAGAVAAWANWPVPNPSNTQLPNPQAYDTSVSGILLDKVTQLQWEASVDGVARTWNDAVAYCASLSDSNGGWRLPSRMELASIVDYAALPVGLAPASFGMLSPQADASMYAYRFWSSSLKAGDETQAWAIDFDTAMAVVLIVPDLLTAPYLVRCVRGGSPDMPANRYTFPSSGVVTDTKTGLSWAQSASDTEMTEPAAVMYCGSLSTAGGGWRLPSLGELQSIVDESRSDPALDATAFPGAPSTDYYWSQSGYAPFDGFGWMVSFLYGLTSVSNQGLQVGWVRCVRP
ncbi:MAG: DUF1566 domain-containing protein [Polyangiaceae bacterium]|nr:DUF1566 domain-containing protein [Polyangiaceae bacterium]